MNKFNKLEIGRSMVEMLGVLAIIGVLSVAGIAGYTSAMRQYRANEIVNATSMLYMMGASQNQGAGDKQMLYSGALGTVPSGVSEITYNADKTISLAFTDTDVCPLVKNKLGDKATGECPTLSVSFGEMTSVASVDLSGITDANECEEKGYFWFEEADVACEEYITENRCYHSRSEAKSLCEKNGDCVLHHDGSCVM